MQQHLPSIIAVLFYYPLKFGVDKDPLPQIYKESSTWISHLKKMRTNVVQNFSSMYLCFKLKSPCNRTVQRNMGPYLP